ncbi:MAG: metallophosphoesterase, partial [Thermoplasmata archaeon]
SILMINAFIILDFGGLNEKAEADGFPREIFIEIHRIMEIDEIDLGSGADWYFYIGVDEGSGYDWKRSSIPFADNLNHVLPKKIFNFIVSSSPVTVAMRLCEDDLFFDDLADISPYHGEGRDDSTSYRRGATCVVSYNLDTHSWTGDVKGSTSEGFSETNGEWDGSYGGDTNDAALWFMIWDDVRVDIAHPIFAVPLIQPKSEPFDIDIHLDYVNTPTSWSSSIFTEYDSYDLQIMNVIQVNPESWRLTASAPSSARCDLYDLKVEVDGIWDIEINAVSLIDSFSSSPKFIHITDLHIDDPDVEFGGGLGDDVVEANVISSVIEEINLIYPDFVIASGDIGDNPEMIGQNEVRQYEKVREVLQKLEVPIYVVNGNHDYDSDTDEGDASILEYRDLINPYRDFSWDYGPYHFIGLDSGEKNAYYGLPGCMMGKGITNSQMNWLQTDFDKHAESSLSFIFMHHTALDPDECPDFPYFNSSISKNQREFLDMCRQNRVAMVLTGHTHIDEVWDRDGNKQTGTNIGNPIPPLYIQTKSVTHDDFNDHHGYRLIRLSEGSVTDFTYDKDGNGNRDAASSIRADKLSLSFFPSNNGTSETVTATIRNDLHESFHDARIVFYMPKPEPGMQYFATGGRIEQKIEYTTYDVYYVRTDIQEESTKDVILQLGYPMYLEQGWNLISLPLVQSDTNLASVLSSIEEYYDAVQWYDPIETEDPWKDYRVGKPYGNDLSDLDEKMGIWIHVTEPDEVLFFCKGILPAQNQIITLHPGWNLVGYTTLSNYNRAGGLNNIVFGVDIDTVQCFDPITKTWHEMEPDEYFIPGRGYWIHSKIDTIWEVPL